VVDLGEWPMILELSRQGLTVAAIARETGHDRETARAHPPAASLVAGRRSA
jgi:transposase